MADGKFTTIENGREVRKQAIDQSTGAGDANRILRTDSTGKIHSSFLPDQDVQTIVAGEDLDAGDFVNIYDNSGVANVRKADNSNNRPAHGYVTSAVTSGQNATVFRENTNASLSGLTIGARYYLGTAGDVTATPTEAANTLHQFLGVAHSATELNVELDDAILIEA